MQVISATLQPHVWDQVNILKQSRTYFKEKYSKIREIGQRVLIETAHGIPFNYYFKGKQIRNLIDLEKTEIKEMLEGVQRLLANIEKTTAELKRVLFIGASNYAEGQDGIQKASDTLSTPDKFSDISFDKTAIKLMEAYLGVMISVRP